MLFILQIAAGLVVGALLLDALVNHTMAVLKVLGFVLLFSLLIVVGLILRQ